MLRIIQDQNTNIGVNGYTFPVGTVFTGFLVITEDINVSKDAVLTVSYDWYVDGGTSPVMGLNLPYNITALANDYLAKYNQALTLNSEITVSETEKNYVNLLGKITITGI
jgi:hypothetical protein